MTAESEIRASEEDILKEGVVEALVAQGREPVLVEVLMGSASSETVVPRVLCYIPPIGTNPEDHFLRASDYEGFFISPDGETRRRATRRLLSEDEGVAIRARIKQASLPAMTETQV